MLQSPMLGGHSRRRTGPRRRRSAGEAGQGRREGGKGGKHKPSQTHRQADRQQREGEEAGRSFGVCTMVREEGVVRAECLCFDYNDELHRTSMHTPGPARPGPTREITASAYSTLRARIYDPDSFSPSVRRCPALGHSGPTLRTNKSSLFSFFPPDASVLQLLSYGT